MSQREHINREGARRGGKEAAEVACTDRDEGTSEDQAPEEDLARQVETRHACPAALRGGRVLGGLPALWGKPSKVLARP
jgi:hypothetical protein